MYHICYHMCTQRSPGNYAEMLYKKHAEVRPCAFSPWECEVGCAMYNWSLSRVTP